MGIQGVFPGEAFALQIKPFTGGFGKGEQAVFTQSGTFVVPAGVGKLRVRVFGGGGKGGAVAGSVGGGGGGGGGFAMLTISGLIPGESIVVTAGSGTNGFGAYVSATGGGNASSSTGGSSGYGVGGDVIQSGEPGMAASSATGGAGGRVASLFGTSVADAALSAPQSIDHLGMGTVVNGANGAFPGGGGTGGGTNNGTQGNYGAKGCVIVEW